MVVKILKAVAYTAGLFGLAFTFNVVQILSSLCIPFNRRLVFRLNSQMCGFVWSVIQTTFEKRHGAKLTFSGNINSIPKYIESSNKPPESAILVSNHVGFVDWILLHSVAKRKGMLDNCKYFVKDSVKYIPGFGWGMWGAGFLFLKRNWLRDQEKIQATFNTLKSYKLPVWIVSFIEGSRVTPKKLQDCQNFCKSRDLPVLHHTLFPRTKGIVATIQSLRDSHIRYLYDFTIGYLHVPSNSLNSQTPSLLRIHSHSLAPEWKFHVHVERYNLDDLPRDDEELSNWIIQLWVEKDKRLGEWKNKWPTVGVKGCVQPEKFW